MNKTYGLASIDRNEAPTERSERYGFVSTASILSALENNGWEIHKITQGKRGRDPSTAKHLVQLTHPGLKATMPDGLVPTINLLNSHNATSALQLKLGIYRLVCANGLMIGEDWAGFRVIHRDTLVRDVLERTEELAARIPQMTNLVGQMKGVKMSIDDANALVQRIVGIRSPVLTEVTTRIDPRSVRPKREADTELDLFTVFNRAQELLIRGGIQYTYRNAHGYDQWGHTRKVSAAGEIMRLNALAFNIATEYLRKAA